ncbi:MAG: hypothetical protein K5988_00550 [Lachnospiraceae bacterium]|nr:hypothetical protein [Lachnospiraceae bacterium]
MSNTKDNKYKNKTNTFIMLRFLSIIGVIYSSLMGLATLIGFIAFAVFLILFFVFLSKSKKKEAETAEL